MDANLNIRRERPAFTPEMAEDLSLAAATLRKGGVVVYPTDTVWGIGCDATCAEAVRRVFEIKQRADSKALITLVGSLAMLERTVEEVPEVAYSLLEVADKPLTIIYDRGRGVAPEVMAPDGTLAVRLTREAFSAELCRRLGRPLVSTSANISGEPTAGCFAEINKELLAKADYVCTSRRDEPPMARPSSIIRLSAGGLFKIIR